MMATRKKTIRELREARAWRPIDLVSKVGRTAQELAHAEIVGPDIAMLENCATAFGVEPDDIALPPHMRLVNVQGHRLLLSTLRDSATTVQARVNGWDPSRARALFQRGPDPDHPDVGSATPLMTSLPGNEKKWRETGDTDELALDALSRRVVAAMERALHPDRLPDDPPTWAPNTHQRL
jgi:transcriptional regulator with XRE-family HTH domain